jgi:hypothetical protein
MPLMVARHCSRVEKPQFLPPPSSPPVYWAHPKLDVTASCRGAAAAAGATEAKATMQRCLDSEQQSRDQAVKRWLDFAPADRSACA